MFLLADFNIDVKMLLLGLTRSIDHGLASVEHAVIVHVVKVVITRILTWVQMRRVPTALGGFRPNCIPRLLASPLDCLGLFGFKCSPHIFWCFLIFFRLQMLIKRP